MDDKLYQKTRDLVQREVICNMTSIVNELLKLSSVDDGPWQEIDQLRFDATDRFFTCDDCGNEWEQSASDDDEQCPKCESENVTEDEDRRRERADETEIYEWWSVSRWAGERLREQGEIVYEDWGHCLWGRCCTGQAIALDNSWQTIAAALKD
jgi:hypothetical protein